MFDSMRNPALRRILGLALSAVLALGATATAQTRHELDPLTDDERQLAERIANDDERVRAMVGDERVRLVYVEFAHVKPARRPASDDAAAGRFAEVLQYRYEDDSGILALVDLEKRAVRDVQRVEGSAVPLTREDLEEAVKLALESDEVRALLGDEASRYTIPDPAARENPPYAIRALLVHAQARRDPCFRHRCVHLFFQQRDAYLTDSAVVDLTARRASIQKGARDETPSN